MWLLALFLLFSIAKAGEVRLCTTPVDLVCRPPNPRPDEIIPGNEGELRSFCSSTTDYVDCLHSYELACKGRSRYKAFNPPLYYSRIKSFLNAACDESSNLNQVLDRSLRCIKQRTSNRDIMCAQSIRRILTAYDKHLEKNPNNKIKGEKEKSLRINCLEIVATASCVIENIEVECGFLAFEASKNAIFKTQILADKCELDTFLELKEVVPQLKISSDLKDNLKKYFVVEIE